MAVSTYGIRKVREKNRDLRNFTYKNFWEGAGSTYGMKKVREKREFWDISRTAGRNKEVFYVLEAEKYGKILIFAKFHVRKLLGGLRGT